MALVGLGCVILGLTFYLSLPKLLPAQAAAADAPTRVSGSFVQLTSTPRPLASPTVQPVTQTPGLRATQMLPTARPSPTHTLQPIDTRSAPTSPAVALPLPTGTLKSIDVAPPSLQPSATAPFTYTPKLVDTPSSPTPTATAAFLPPARPADNPQPTATASPSPTTEVGQVGQRIIASGIGLTVVGVAKQSEFAPVYLIIDVIIENVSRDEGMPYDPIHFRLQDSEGYRYDATFWVPYTTLDSGVLAKGSQARGKVAFEIEPTASGFMAMYDLTELPGGFQAIRIDLGQ
jgi:hypothetical protein